MGLAEEYAKRVKKPLLKLTVTRFTDTPSVDAEGTDYYPEVIDIDNNHGYDQASATCSLVIKSPLDINGDYVRFQPMDRVEVKQGWNKTSTNRITFFGFIDTVEFSNPPKLQRLECRDILKLAQDNYLIHSNRKVYSQSPSTTEFDDEGNPMGGQSAENRTVQAIISTFLTDSGIPVSRQNLDFIAYPESGSLVVGNHAEAVFVYESAMDSINRVCDLIGWRIWANPVGQVQCREVRPVASSTAALTYKSQEEIYDEDAGFVVVTSGNLATVESRMDDDLRNWITVIGYDGLTTTVAGESEYISSPPTYRRTEVRSYLLDTQAMVQAVAERIYSDINRLRYTARATIEGDPRLEIGQTIQLNDSYATISGTNYFLNGYSSRMGAGEYLTDLTLVGGIGTGSNPIGNVSPVALFNYEVQREVLASGTWNDVFVDASESYDPDGDIADLSYLWVCSGYANATGIRHDYFVSGEIPSMVVNLTVTDSGSPPLSNTTSWLILTTPGNSIKWKAIFVASGSSVWTTPDGGETWVEKTLY